MMRNNEKYFLLHLESSFCSQDILDYSRLFGHVKNGLIKDVKLISKFMTSQPGYETIAIRIYISRCKGNQTMKFGQLIRIFFLKNRTQNLVEKLFQEPFLKSQN